MVPRLLTVSGARLGCTVSVQPSIAWRTVLPDPMPAHFASQTCCGNSSSSGESVQVRSAHGVKSALDAVRAVPRLRMPVHVTCPFQRFWATPKQTPGQLVGRQLDILRTRPSIVWIQSGWSVLPK